MVVAKSTSSHSAAISGLVQWILFALSGIVLAWLTGRLVPSFVPDSPSYQDYSFASLTEMCLSIRTPGYPAWLSVVRSTLGIDLVPLGQVVVHATACWFLFSQLRQWTMPTIQAMVLAGSVGVGCTAMDNIQIISTDAMAASMGVLVATSLLRSTRLKTLRSAMLPVVFSVLAIFIRPAYLFLIPWLFAAGALLLRYERASWKEAFSSSAVLSLLVLLPVVGWMTVRWAKVDDFGMLPFGHQNLGGVLVQLVSDDELQSLGDMGRAVVQQKAAFVRSGGEFSEGEPGATMTIDARWDAMTYFIVVPAAVSVAGTDPIKSHHAIAEMNKAIIKRWPARYLRWIAKAVRRGAWAIAADMVMHPVFLAALMCASVLVVYRSVQRLGRATPPASDGLRMMVIVAITYVAAKLLFVALTSPPIGRFSDAAAIFIPGTIAAAFIHWWIGSAETSDTGGGRTLATGQSTARELSDPC